LRGEAHGLPGGVVGEDEEAVFVVDVVDLVEARGDGGIEHVKFGGDFGLGGEPAIGGDVEELALADGFAAGDIEGLGAELEPAGEFAGGGIVMPLLEPRVVSAGEVVTEDEAFFEVNGGDEAVRTIGVDGAAGVVERVGAGGDAAEIAGAAVEQGDVGIGELDAGVEGGFGAAFFVGAGEAAADGSVDDGFAVSEEGGADGGVFGPVDGPVEAEFVFEGSFDGDDLFAGEEFDAADDLLLDDGEAGFENAGGGFGPGLADGFAVAGEAGGLLFFRGGAEAIDAEEVAFVVAVALPHWVRFVGIGEEPELSEGSSGILDGEFELVVLDEGEIGEEEEEREHAEFYVRIEACGEFFFSRQ
jgi:hypothetical protein